MMRYIEKTNLPQGKVKTIICGTTDECILEFFNNNNISVIDIEPNSKIDSAVSSHADMAAFHLGKNIVITDKKQHNLQEKLLSLGFEVCLTQKEIAGKYPSDVALNFAVTDKNIVGKFKYADENLLSMISDMKKINVNQGYCKCSVLVIDENAVITDDESIHRKMLENDIDSLLVSKGDVSLPGHEYGFIGGASGKISKDTVVFFGDIRTHRDFESIASFIKFYGCKYVCTDNKALRDIGGFVSIIEE